MCQECLSSGTMVKRWRLLSRRTFLVLGASVGRSLGGNAWSAVASNRKCNQTARGGPCHVAPIDLCSADNGAYDKPVSGDDN